MNTATPSTRTCPTNQHKLKNITSKVVTLIFANFDAQNQQMLGNN